MWCGGWWCCGGCFVFSDTATTEIYTLSLHDALPISAAAVHRRARAAARGDPALRRHRTATARRGDRKSTRLNSSHVEISYAVFCLKKKIKSPAVRGEPSSITAHGNTPTFTSTTPTSD